VKALIAFRFFSIVCFKKIEPAVYPAFDSKKLFEKSNCKKNEEIGR